MDDTFITTEEAVPMGKEVDATPDNTGLLLHAEQTSVTRRRVEGDTVRVSTITHTTEKTIEEALLHERIELEHVTVGRRIDTVPAIRHEGDVMIIPVVEEIIFVEKRLVLKEEIHIRRVRVPDVHREVVTLRTQDIVVERTKPGARQRDPEPELAPIPRQ